MNTVLVHAQPKIDCKTRVTVYDASGNGDASLGVPGTYLTTGVRSAQRCDRAEAVCLIIARRGAA